MRKVFDWLNASPRFIPPRLWILMDVLLMLSGLFVWSMALREVLT